MSLISRSVDLDIPPDMRLTSQYRATLGHKACHDFAKKNAAFQWVTTTIYKFLIRTVLSENLSTLVLAASCPLWPSGTLKLVKRFQKHCFVIVNKIRHPGTNCVTRAPLLYFIRSWVALSFKVVSEWVSQWGIGNTCPNLHFLQYIKAWMSSTDPVSSIINCYCLIVSYTDPVQSFIIS